MSNEERRAPGAARIPFDGVVEVGGALGPCFEAQAVNVSEEGMQLRTAYLPELGQQVTCRFEATPSESIIGSGEVVWCRGAERGGEFGIRFTDIDADSVDALKRACGFAGAPAPAQAGAKVRLYIDGLASPMRAKIRDARPEAVTVGSDLGFLQVGRQLELEDAQSGDKRPASIDRVEVAVDPTSHVPQLIVTLRYEDVAAPASSREAPEHEGDASDGARSVDQAAAQMKGAFAKQAARIGPALERFSRRAMRTAALLAKRRGEDDTMPRRTTAPPPGGGLRATGRKVVRGEVGGGQSVAGATPPAFLRGGRRKAMVASCVMIAAIGAAIGMKRGHYGAGAAAASPTASAEIAATVGGSASAAATASVVSAPVAEKAPSPEPSPGLPVTAAPTETAAPAREGSDEPLRTPAKTHARVIPFGNGPVHHGNVLRLKMDGAIESIEGAQQPAGFAVKLPGRRSLEAAAPLAARDSRIGSIKVVNETAGAELTVTFKDGVPNYQVSAKGETLVIALAPPGPLEATVAKRDDKTAKAAKHGARAHDLTPER